MFNWVAKMSLCRVGRAGSVLGFALLGWALAGSAAQAQTTVIEVPTVSVQTQAVGGGFALDAVVTPVRQAVVSALATGRVVQLAVKPGDRVRAGQTLALIDDRETVAGVQRSNAALAQVQAQLANAQAQHQRTRDLQRQGFVSAAALDAADAQLKSAQGAYDQAVAGVRLSSLAQAYARVTAPFDAWVQSTQVEVGALAMPGTPLVTVYAPQPLRAVVQVPVSRLSEVDARSVQVGLPAGDGRLQWVKPTRVTRVPAADTTSQTQEWRLELPATQAQALVPGQPVRVQFAVGQVQRSLLPSQAVLRRGEMTAVYVAQAKGFSLRTVRLGEDHGSAGVEVWAGLSAGDRVALDPVRAGLAGARPALR